MKVSDLYKKLTIFFENRKKLLHILIILICFLPAIPGSILGYSGAMRSVDYMFEDTTYQKAREVNPDIVVIHVTSDNLKLFNANALDIGELSHLINALNKDPENRPAAIGVANLVRSIGNEKEDSDLLLAVQSGNVVLGDMLNISKKIQVGDESCVNEDFNIYTRVDSSMIFNPHCDSGYLNIISDTDGFVRNYLWNATISEQKKKSFAEAIYDVYCNSKNIEESEKFSPEYSKDGFFMIPFSQEPGGFTTIDYHSVIQGTIDPSTYAGKIIIIGTADTALSSGYTTAISRNEQMYNCDIQANVISNLLERKSLMQVPLKTQLIILTIVTWGMAILVIEFPFIYSLLYAIISLLISFTAAKTLWDKGLSIHPLYYLATMLVAVFISIFVNAQKLRSRQEVENEVLSRYLDKNVINEIISRNDKKEIGNTIGKSEKVAVLFADIRGFTSISEELGPENTVNLLNDFLSAAEQCIHTYDGTVDKYIGDCIMAFWVDTEKDRSVVHKACKAGLDIVKIIQEKEEYYYKKYNREITFGIGIDYGDAIVGDIGSTSRKDYTIVGNTVNFASRLESTAPKGMVLVSQSIYRTIYRYADCQIFAQKLTVRGFAQQLSAYVLNAISDTPLPLENIHYKPYDQSENYIVYTFGTRGSFPVTGRRYSEFGGSTTCFVLKRKNHAIVYDCGTGLLEAKEVLSDCNKIDVIMSHIHYDHCIGLLSWYSVFPKEAEINFYGNFKAWFGKETLDELFRPPFWPVDYANGLENNIHSIEDFSEILTLDDDISIRFYESDHPNGATIVHMNAGNNSICIMVDCETSDGLPFEIVKDADILIYDGMFDESEYANKVGWGHSTWQQGVELAKKANVGRLIITHHNPDAWDSELRMREKEAQKMFKNTEFARNGNKIVFRAKNVTNNN